MSALRHRLGRAKNGWAVPILLICATSQAPAHAQTVLPQLSIALAPLAGPQYTPAFGQVGIGFYGTDLGFTMKHEGNLRILFGDSWAGNWAPSIGPIGDDSQGTICMQAAGCPFGGIAFPDGDSVQAFTGTSGLYASHVGPPLVFRLNAFGKVAPVPMYDGGASGTLLDSGPLKTPTSAFSNGRPGTSSGAFALFGRGEAVACSSCAAGFTCEPSLGVANKLPCVLTDPGCSAVPGGICVDTTSPRYGSATPKDKLRGAVLQARVGNADPTLQEVYYTKVWNTHKFSNPSATTVNSYTMGASVVADPSPASAPASSLEKVFVWGRPSFAGISAQSAKLYFAVVDNPNYAADASFPWLPQYFAGMSGGAPTFSGSEAAAVALVDVHGSSLEPLDIVNQLSVRYLPELQKWVLLYGGDLEPNLLRGAATGGQQALMHTNPQGGIFARFAAQPWGPWGDPQLLLAAGDSSKPAGQYGPGGILHQGSCTPTSACAPAEPFWDTFLSPPSVPGYLYGPNLIPEWTENRGNTVDIYWNVSTFAPYQVVLMRSTIQK